jgi:hypothetical protein
MENKKLSSLNAKKKIGFILISKKALNKLYL